MITQTVKKGTVVALGPGQRYVYLGHKDEKFMFCDEEQTWNIFGMTWEQMNNGTVVGQVTDVQGLPRVVGAR